MKQNIAIVMGGYSSEHDISVKSGHVVKKHLDSTKYNTFLIHITKKGWDYLNPSGERIAIDRADFSLTLNGKKIHFDCVFNAIHGTPGEDGQLQAYLGLVGIPHTSCDYYQSALTFNKRDLLSSLKPYGIKCATSYYLNKGEDIDTKAIIAKVGLPCFVKANRAGSSFGISKVYEEYKLEAAIHASFEEDGEIIIESFLEGTEVSVGVITHKGKITVLPITEIVPQNDFFDYAAKYEGLSQEITPARISEELRLKVVEISEKIYQKLKLKGYTRSEFIFVDGEPYLLEVNTTPGLTEESILPQQAKEAGISLPELFESALVEAMR